MAEAIKLNSVYFVQPNITNHELECFTICTHCTVLEHNKDVKQHEHRTIRIER